MITRMFPRTLGIGRFDVIDILEARGYDMDTCLAVIKIDEAIKKGIAKDKDVTRIAIVGGGPVWVAYWMVE